jgi:hypothetical protein
MASILPPSVRLAIYRPLVLLTWPLALLPIYGTIDCCKNDESRSVSSVRHSWKARLS